MGEEIGGIILFCVFADLLHQGSGRLLYPSRDKDECHGLYVFGKRLSDFCYAVKEEIKTLVAVFMTAGGGDYKCRVVIAFTPCHRICNLDES